MEDVVRLARHQARLDYPLLGHLEVGAEGDLVLVVGVDILDRLVEGRLDVALEAVVALGRGVPPELVVDVLAVVLAGELLEHDAHADRVVVAPQRAAEQDAAVRLHVVDAR